MLPVMISLILHVWLKYFYYIFTTREILSEKGHLKMTVELKNLMKSYTHTKWLDGLKILLIPLKITTGKNYIPLCMIAWLNNQLERIAYWPLVRWSVSSCFKWIFNHWPNIQQWNLLESVAIEFFLIEFVEHYFHFQNY